MKLNKEIIIRRKDSFCMIIQLNKFFIQKPKNVKILDFFQISNYSFFYKLAI